MCERTRRVSQLSDWMVCCSFTWFLVLLLLQENFVDVINNQEFLSLPSEELAKLLMRDDLNVPSEEMVFHSLILWAKHNRSSLLQSLPRLLECVRLPLLIPQVSSRFCV